MYPSSFIHTEQGTFPDSLQESLQSCLTFANPAMLQA